MSDLKDNGSAPDTAPVPPADGQVKTFAGRGSGNTCVLCGLAISASEIEYEVEWERNRSIQRSRFHMLCYELWWSQQA